MKNFLLILVAVLCLPVPSVGQDIKVYARDFEPFFYRDGGETKGLEYDILSYFSKASGRALDIHWVAQFDELLPAVRDGSADVATGTITITEERAQTVDFSGSYFPVRVAVIEPKSRTSSAVGDLSGLSISTMAGTTYERILKELPGIELVYGVDEEAIIAMVAAGEAEATLVDTVLGLIYTPRHGNLHMTLPMSELQNYGFAVPKGSALAEELSDHIQKLKTSGIYYRLLEKYLGQEAVDMVRAAHLE